MFSIYELSDEENRLVQEAKNNYGRYFTFAKDVVEYSWTFIDKIDARAYVFNAFLTQMNKSLSLSLLSIIRLHTIQSYQSLRSAIESVGLASYSLYKPEQNNYVRKNPELPGHLIAKSKSKVDEKVNKWLDINYPIYSEKLKHLKTNHINKYFAHSNLVDALTNVKFVETKSYNSVFDDNNLMLTKIQLTSLSNTTILMTDLLGLALDDYPLAKVNSSHREKLEQFYSINKQMYNNLKKDPSFPRY